MKTISTIGIFGVLATVSYFAFKYYNKPVDSIESNNSYPNKWPALGKEVERVHNIPIYSNGEQVYKSHGKHYATDGYYYGRKWQCVEFIKRYLYDHLGHRMPNVWGHAKSFFDPNIAQGQLNPDRNLHQYRNCHPIPPAVNDLIVWDGKYGHVAIVTAVHSDYVVIAQQNIKNQPIAKIPLALDTANNYTLGNAEHASKLLGWLRIPDRTE